MEALAYKPVDSWSRRHRAAGQLRSRALLHHRPVPAGTARAVDQPLVLATRAAAVAAPARTGTPTSVRRAGALTALVACIAIAGGYFGVAYHVVFQSHIGYTVAETGPTHGINSGDMFALPFVLLTALCLTFAVYFYAEFVTLRRPSRRWRAR
jgi:hypothetical protein